MPHILAIDQSTSTTKALIFDQAGRCVDRESKAHQQYYPQPGWVEHDAEEIWQNLLASATSLINRNPNIVDDLVGISLANQRETVVVFDKKTGAPLHRAIVWQCRRSENICTAHCSAGKVPLVQSRTGLRIDPYFSASKLQWLVENCADLKQQLENGTALIGTIDTYLIYRLTREQVFATDATNASRTLLFDIAKIGWDKELCELWHVPMHALADVRDSNAQFGESTLNGLLSQALPIVAVIGDSQASLFAQRCFQKGSAKVTFGTGSSILLNIGAEPIFSHCGVVTALAWVLNDTPTYALEGIVINSAATLEWLKNQMGFVTDVAEFETLAAQVEDAGGVFLVPAFSGLGLPYWQPKARAAIVGLSGYSDRRHLARAATESIAYQLRDAIDAMQAESGVPMRELKADGGPTKNNLLMKFTADIAQTEIAVSTIPECSALGAALLGFFGLGIHKSLASIAELAFKDVIYEPTMQPSRALKYHNDWTRAVKQVLSGAETQAP